MASRPAKPEKSASPAPVTRWYNSGALSTLFIVAATYLFFAVTYQASHVLGFSVPLLSRLPRPSFLQPKAATIPSHAQVIDQRAFNALPHVPPSTEFNGTGQPFVPPGHTLDSLKARPFHIYDPAFAALLGPDPTLTRIAVSDKDPLFHEAVVWSRGTDEVFFVQNAGAPDAGTGLAKSAIIQKISLRDAQAAADRKRAGASEADTVVPVAVVDASPQVVNPNGAANYRGQILFAGEGMGPDVPSALYAMHPRPPYNTTVLLNNYFGRQFSSLNDVAVHPASRHVYFTDTLYGFLQDFRPAPGLPNQVYRWNDATGAVTVVADGFTLPNGLAFSPDGRHAYVSDTGMHHGLRGFDLRDPATIYRFDVRDDGTFDNRKTFAHVDAVVPDGVHCDAEGNVYAGCGDGIQVWNPAGTLLGKIFLGTGAANFQFAGAGRMVVCAETELYYVTLAAVGAVVEAEM
ncbi:gluconolactonase [Sporothrix schenckii 1099-18]|uniref:Gluconolactonase n=1 Tax=Sporothrix schenckii 1099-18 TaxID=1397361 RepID=A0A0F2MHD3_SPOSC|nr:gluconolactonase [Sporothrix schenckii 1099-18]KJR88275.1 gluconolactonase [Sporothrix schenckii 1099-18]